MSTDSDRLSIKNTDPAHTAADIRNKPSTGVATTHALLAKQYGTSGQGAGLRVESDNSAEAAAIVQGAGALLDLRNSAGESQLRVENDGSLASLSVDQLTVVDRLTANGWTLPVIPFRRAAAWRDAASIVTSFQTSHGWSATGGNIASSNLNDTTDFVRGTQSAKFTTNGAGGASGSAGQANLQKLGMTSFDLTGKMIRLLVKVENGANINELNLFVGTSSLGSNFKWKLWATTASSKTAIDGEWCILTAGWGNVNTATGYTIGSTGIPSTTTGFTDIRVQVIDNNVSGATLHVQAVEIVDDTTTTFPNGVVSITFDDSYQSVYDYARPKMDALGFRGTQYTIAEYIGSSGNFLTMPELRSLQNNSGWEIAGHAYTSNVHDNRLPTYTAAQVDDEMRNLRAWLVTNGFDGDTYAYPGGRFEYTTDGVSVEQIVSRYFSAGRTILYSVGTSTNVVGETFPVAMRYRMRGLSSISSLSTGQPNPTTMTSAGGALDRVANGGGWLNLCFHRIVTGSPTATTECSQTDFNTIMDAIAARGIKVLPVGDVLNYYT